ncbi:Uncharacterized protein C9orf85 like protein [Habropoda laboriosa]|uniref:Uncharacterized protein C9orf85 like protein n=1 Tax=Habropoda laboriosa TaxID=597456 RepID=A0A0L7QP13_9HYME|nr:PREDICTED: uncharacterized protein C9orf85 homolog [Habropoda laboriosa]KOC60319.1 Uncharacterized protein C9orf85 like protein [Habropoda laboriosa]
MSTQKGNSSRSRPQKYQNHTVFKNDLHDKSNKTKLINSIDVANVCERCKKVIEWKIKYKKYKPLKTPAKCVKCEQKTIKHAYHKICLLCAKQCEICPKCGNKANIVEGKPSKEEAMKLDTELQSLLKSLSERKRRTFIRYMNRNDINSKHNLKKNKNVNKNEDEETDEDSEQEQDTSVMETTSKETLLLKLKSLIIKEEDSDDFNSDDDLDSIM